MSPMSTVALPPASTTTPALKLPDVRMAPTPVAPPLVTVTSPSADATMPAARSPQVVMAPLLVTATSPASAVAQIPETPSAELVGVPVVTSPLTTVTSPLLLRALIAALSPSGPVSASTKIVVLVIEISRFASAKMAIAPSPVVRI
ncbi:hypothetical protein D3C80_1139990 [compost metagenome]